MVCFSYLIINHFIVFPIRKKKMELPSSLNACVIAKALCACALKVSTRIKKKKKKKKKKNTQKKKTKKKTKKRTLNNGSYGCGVELNFVSILF